MAKYEMKSRRLARILAGAYGYLPAKRYVLKIICIIEGGQMTSLTMRQILSDYHAVDVGIHSYGSLLELGMADPGTSIGAYVSSGPNVRRIGAAHPLGSPLLHPYWYNAAFGLVSSTEDVPRSGCAIGEDVWLGANVTILPGCTRIGRGAVVGAGAIVTKDIDSFTIWGGVPARQISARFDEETRLALAEMDSWSLEPELLHEKVASRLRRAGVPDSGPSAE